MDREELTKLSSALHKFYDIYKDKLSVAERHSLIKSYLTIEFFDTYVSKVEQCDIPIIIEAQ